MALKQWECSHILEIKEGQMDKTVRDLLEQQIKHELYSAYLYLGFSNFYIEKNLDGFGHWFKLQAEEEVGHAMKFLKYLQDNDQKVELEAIEKPDCNFNNFKQPLEASLKHEQLVTGLINIIYKAARQADDYRCMQFLEWFIAEQAEEEKNATDLIAKYDLFGTEAKGLYLLNQELGGRTITAEATE